MNLPEKGDKLILRTGRPSVSFGGDSTPNLADGQVLTVREIEVGSTLEFCRLRFEEVHERAAGKHPFTPGSPHYGYTKENGYYWYSAWGREGNHWRGRGDGATAKETLIVFRNLSLATRLVAI